MNKILKRILIIFCSVLVVLGAVLSFNIINNKSKVTSKEEEEIQVNPITREKADNALLEDTVRNFRSIYVNLVNDKELDFSFLNNVITKDSEIYKNVVEDITQKRSKNIKIENQNVDVKDIKDIADGYEISIIITYSEIEKDKTNAISVEQKFKLTVKDNNITIKEID
jgi:uncharacterized membrane protein